MTSRGWVADAVLAAFAAAGLLELYLSGQVELGRPARSSCWCRACWG